MTHHEQELSELKQRLLNMGSRAELAVAQAIEALTNRDADLARRVREGDTAIDQLELEIDDQAVRLLSHAPLAGDLRLVLVIMRASQNLERVADEACKIANRARDLTDEPPLKAAVDIPHIARMVLDMVKRVLDAFVRGDVDEARSLIPLDKEVDALHKEYSERLVGLMTQDPDTIQRCLHYLTIIKRLERIADHAKNMAEEIVFMCEAQDIRHAAKLGTPPQEPAP
ncbi:MAG: phosphate signaling complex protein PhoU [Verrucomicrobia bacterium]|jgi:phosphate transport system protein|nr:phosphate signaling complex protein PhoU [Verrucomicrobiota bacterium]